jgi:hypothetical protein
MKCDWIPTLRARRLAACGHNTNWDAEPAQGPARVNLRWVHNTIPLPPRLLGRAPALLKEACSHEMVKGPLLWKSFGNKRRKNRC